MEKKSLHYGWIIFAVCFLMVFTTLGFCSSVKGLYLAAITEDLGISRSLFSISDSCRHLANATINLFFGRLVLKFGARKLAGMGFVSLVLSSLCNAFSDGIAMFYLGGALLGLGLAWTTTALVGYVVERWFTSRKGSVMGIILAANGLGGAVASQILSPLIFGSEGSWRKSYLLVAVILGVVGLIVVAVLRSTPEEKGLQPLGTGVLKSKKEPERLGISVEEALQKPYFYVCSVCVFLTGLVLQSITSISSAHMQDRGISTTLISAALSVHSLSLAAAKVITGFNFDRFGLRITMLISHVLAVVSILLLAFITDGPMVWVFQIMCAFALPLETIMLPLITAEVFGQKSYAFIMGLMISFNVTGYAVGTPLLNLVFDITGTYQFALIIMAGVMVIITAAMQMVLTASHKT